MPRKKRSALTRTHWQSAPLARYLLSGYDAGPLDGVAYRVTEHPPREEVKALWTEVGDQVTEWYAARNPGKRPFFWWEFSAPSPRRENETQEQYLRRHRLLSPTEKKRLQDPRGPGLPPGCRIVHMKQPRRISGTNERND